MQTPRIPKPLDKMDRIAFYGPMCVGKTFCANYLVENCDYEKISFADKLKALAYDLFGVQGKGGASRKLYQELGTALRAFDEDVWINALLMRVSRSVLVSRPIVVDDLRYVNEAKALKRAGFVLVQVICDEGTRMERVHVLYPDTLPSSHEHPSEQQWKMIRPDYTVISNTYDTIIDLERLVNGETA